MKSRHKGSSGLPGAGIIHNPASNIVRNICSYRVLGSRPPLLQSARQIPSDDDPVVVVPHSIAEGVRVLDEHGARFCRRQTRQHSVPIRIQILVIDHPQVVAFPEIVPHTYVATDYVLNTIKLDKDVCAELGIQRAANSKATQVCQKRVIARWKADARQLIGTRQFKMLRQIPDRCGTHGHLPAIVKCTGLDVGTYLEESCV